MENNHSRKNTRPIERTSKLQQWLENIWYNNGSGKILLVPLTALYCAINSFQRFKYSNNKTKLPCPVIVVGNITVGGTGKTPLTIYLAKLLQQAGYRPAIITRGYGGQATKWPQSVSAKSDPRLVGDEAVLMASRTQIPVYAGSDRLQSIDALTKAHDCDVIISDDGMQHYKLPRDIQIAVLDGTRMLGNGWCLPAGPLREKKQRLNACDLLVVNGEIEESRKDNVEMSEFFTMHLEGITLTNIVSQEQQTFDKFSLKNSATTVHAVTGIGNPQRFFQTLEKQGGLQLKTHSFPDHHDFIESDFKFDDDLPIVMTEKDAVKCKNFATVNFWSLAVSGQLDQTFAERLIGLLEKGKED